MFSSFSEELLEQWVDAQQDIMEVADKNTKDDAVFQRNADTIIGVNPVAVVPSVD